MVGDRWSLLVVRELLYGVRRFSRIAENTGAPTDVLTARLRKLVEGGVIEARPYSERPPRSEYHLTDAGRQLAPALLLLLAWGDRWGGHEPPVPLLHRPGPGGDAHPVVPMLTCGACGEPVGGASLLTEDAEGPPRPLLEGLVRAGAGPARRQAEPAPSARTTS